MSVIGIDFGNDNCYIAVARQGGIETVANDYSLRATPSCVAFGEKNRILGVAAKNQFATNMKNTCFNFKKLVGKKYSDPRILKDLKELPYKVIKQPDGSIGIVVRYLNEEHVFSPTQVTAMLFSKLKQTAETALGTKVCDVVIGIPCYADDAERHAMLEAATAAGFNVLRLMNETTATALAYGIYKQDLPNTDEKPRNVVFVDCGHTSLQVSAVAFNKGKLKMLATASDSNLGGRDFDNRLAQYFASDFNTRYKIDATSNARAWYRLILEAEKVKKQMSANSTQLPLNIECFMNDKDVSGKINRVNMEELSAPLFQQIETTLITCLKDSNLKLDDIYGVEIVGGSTRIPAIKQCIEKVFGKTPSTTLNQDEAVARGCALQCAMLSPAFKVREFSVTDVQPYCIRLMWQDESGQEGDMEVFPKNHEIPFSKMLTFHRKDSFTVQAQYSQPSPNPDPIIGHFTIQNVSQNGGGEPQKVKVKVRVNLHGLFTVASASLHAVKKEVPAEECQENTSMEVEEKEKDLVNGPESNQESNDQQHMEQENKKDNKENSEQVETGNTEKKAKKIIKSVDLPVSAIVHALSQAELNNITEKEAQMVQADRLENERINAKNAVEEYVYETRGKIHDELEAFITENDRSKLSMLLDDTENWLYEDGEDCFKQIYVDKLAELKKLGEPIKERRRQREELPRAFEEFLCTLQLVRKAYDQYKEGSEKYSHLDSAEMEKVDKTIAEKQMWIDEKMGLISSTPIHCDVPVTSSQVLSEKSLFEALVNPIINKPKPKPKVEEPPPSDKDHPEKNGQQQESEQKKRGKGKSGNPESAENATEKQEAMDVD